MVFSPCYLMNVQHNLVVGQVNCIILEDDTNKKPKNHKLCAANVK